MSTAEEKWDGSFRDEIQCPHCGAIDYERTDYPRSLQLDGDHTETDCDSCGEPMTVVLSVTYEYATAPVPPAPATPDAKDGEP